MLALTRAAMADRHDALAQIQVSMTPGGLLRLAEPQPNRVWDLRFGADPAWWRAGTQTTPLQDGSEWLQNLQAAAGFGEAIATPLQAAVWGVNMISARAHGALRTGAVRIAADAGLLIVSSPGDFLAGAIADGNAFAGPGGGETVARDGRHRVGQSGAHRWRHRLRGAGPGRGRGHHAGDRDCRRSPGRRRCRPRRHQRATLLGRGVRPRPDTRRLPPHSAASRA